MPVPLDAALCAHLPHDLGVAAVRDGDAVVVHAGVREVLTAHGAAGFTALDHAARGGWWAGVVSFDLGRAVERVVTRNRDDLGIPDVVLARFEARAVVADGDVTVEGTGAGRLALDQARWRARRSGEPGGETRVRLGPWQSSLSRAEHAERVHAVHELLRAGECYQVNLTRRLTARGAPDARALYGALADAHPAPQLSVCTFGGDGPDLATVSASPELYLRVDGRRVTTRPIKGTARDAGALARSEKDAAENVMIVDLARNDLGRVCTPGTVRVPELLTIEAHPGLCHLVSTVEGELDPGVGLGDLVRATFPPASVTGAPKPRVLQAIEDLEPVRRGVYCGAIGWIDGDRGTAQLAVAIRTFTLVGGRTHFGVGGGIVADSRADDEWAETELKAARLLAVVGREAGDEVGTGHRVAP
ncbi:MAG TPA: anthranilate synthase component I family protein [Acidimicrobiia bacterium]|nr:anthranilate synthase component I family protein [Acidimicrobiia bacterium]